MKTMDEGGRPDRCATTQTKGVVERGYNMPRYVYLWHLGWLLGHRFLLLTHTGRNSGLPRQTILEVLQHETASDAYYVLSGWGGKADWLRNVEKTPEVIITVGRRQCMLALNVLGLKKPNAPSWRMPNGILSQYASFLA